MSVTPAGLAHMCNPITNMYKIAFLQGKDIVCAITNAEFHPQAQHYPLTQKPQTDSAACSNTILAKTSCTTAKTSCTYNSYSAPSKESTFYFLVKLVYNFKITSSVFKIS